MVPVDAISMRRMVRMKKLRIKSMGRCGCLDDEFIVSDLESLSEDLEVGFNCIEDAVVELDSLIELLKLESGRQRQYSLSPEGVEAYGVSSLV